MRDLPLNALRAFAAVHLSGGIRPAGRALGVSHSSVARHVAELEALIGAPLIDRGGEGRALAFTPLGERLGEAASKTFGSLDRTWTAARERRSANAVTISAALSFAVLWLLPRLPRLTEAHPRIEVSVLAEQRVRAPSEEGSDLSIRMGRPRRGERAVPFMDDALTPVASPRLLVQARAARGGPTGDASAAALLDLPLLHDRDPNAGWSAWTEHHEPTGPGFAHGPRFSSSDLVLRAAKQSQGVGLARLRLAEDDIASGALERLSDDAVPLPDAYWIVMGPEGEGRASVRAVRDWLIREGNSAVTP